MRSAETVLTAKTTERLEDIIPRLNKVSGLPVVDASNRVIGVISRKVSPKCCAVVCSWHAWKLPDDPRLHHGFTMHITSTVP